MKIKEPIFHDMFFSSKQDVGHPDFDPPKDKGNGKEPDSKRTENSEVPSSDSQRQDEVQQKAKT